MKSFFTFILIIAWASSHSQIAFTNGTGLTQTEDFNSLSNTTAASLLPANWILSESGTNANATYGVDNGSLTTGNTYSYGTASGPDRSLGELTSGSLTSSFGVSFINNTDSFIRRLNISFYTELWRKGVSGVTDSLIFEYSTDATSLTTGIWLPVVRLNPKSPNLLAAVGAVNGDLSANRLFVNDSITGISVAPNSTIWIRWRAVNISGNDDGLGIDDFSVTAVKGAQLIIPATISILGTHKTVNEAAGSATVYLKINGTNGFPASIDVSVSARSTAQNNSDFTYSTSTITFPATAQNNDSIAVVVNLNDDALSEADEYLILSLSNGVNAVPFGANIYYLYIKDNDMPTPAGTQELTISLLTSFSNGPSGINSAEIVSYDSLSKRLFIANSINARLDIVDFNNPSNPILLDTIDISVYGNINSVACRNGLIAAAVENTNPQDSGKVVFFDTAGVFLKSVNVGMMPDMITFNHSGTKLLTANEGEPNNAYTIDPEGSISIIDISNGISSLQQSNVSHVEFVSFNGSETFLRSQGIRIYGLNANASRDFEPEYITVSDDDSKAWVSLQENNAIAEIDLQSNNVIRLIPLGFKNHQLTQNGMDVSDVTSAINISNWPVKGMYLPDAISHYTVGNSTYLVSANEGDSRAYAGYNEESRVSGLILDPVKFPNASELKNTLSLGRLNATKAIGDSDGDGDIDSIYVYGARSFSVWDVSSGNQVYDSGSEIERITASHTQYSSFFNASNGTSNAIKNRSDDKGPEPEGVAIASINNKNYVFIALERIGGMMAYNIDNPSQPYYVNYVNNRPQDRGSEGIVFIPADQSPNGKSLVILANETSSTLSIYQVESCISTLDVSLTSTSTGFCPGDSVTIQGGQNTGVSYQWLKSGTVLTSDTLNTLSVQQQGTYSLILDKGQGCVDTSLSITILSYPAPDVILTPSDSAFLCQNDSLLISAVQLTGNHYQWFYNGNQLSQDTLSSLYAQNPGSYSVLVTTQNLCADTSVNFNLFNYPNPAIPLVTQQSDTLFATAANSYQWYLNGNILLGETNFYLVVTQNGQYSVETIDTNGCNSVSSAFNYNFVGDKNLSLEFTSRLIPNPFESSAEIIITNSTATELMVKVYNTLGNLVYSNIEKISSQTTNKVVLPFSNFNSGIYYIILESMGKVKTIKAIKTESK